MGKQSPYNSIIFSLGCGKGSSSARSNADVEAELGVLYMRGEEWTEQRQRAFIHHQICFHEAGNWLLRNKSVLRLSKDKQNVD